MHAVTGIQVGSCSNVPSSEGWLSERSRQARSLRIRSFATIILRSHHVWVTPALGQRDSLARLERVIPVPGSPGGSRESPQTPIPPRSSEHSGQFRIPKVLFLTRTFLNGGDQPAS